MFLDFRFYFAKKTIDAEKVTAKIKGAVVPFQTKLELAGQMMIGIGDYFATSPLLAVTDSWFGNQSRSGRYWGIVFICYLGCAAITCCMPNLTHGSLDREDVGVSTVNAWDR